MMEVTFTVIATLTTVREPHAPRTLDMGHGGRCSSHPNKHREWPNEDKHIASERISHGAVADFAARRLGRRGARHSRRPAQRDATTAAPAGPAAMRAEALVASGRMDDAPDQAVAGRARRPRSASVGERRPRAAEPVGRWHTAL
jgi:hypothetical protein